MSPDWPGNASGSSPDTLDELAGEREVCASLLRLRPDPTLDKRWKMDRWMELLEIFLPSWLNVIFGFYFKLCISFPWKIVCFGSL